MGANQEKLILINHLSPGDLVMLTAAVRDLHQSYPGRFLTDVRTGSSELWENNPYLTPLEVNDPEVRALACHYPLVAESNQRPVHFVHGFIDFLNCELGLEIKPSRIAGDIYLSADEKEQPSPVEERTGLAMPYWIVVAGGKLDFTIKWWHFRRWQAVVNQFQKKILFVQVGEKHHYHPALNGVLDFRGQTPIRELLRLVYHAQGIICPVTFLMHLAAAVERKPDCFHDRPCVVVAGGREPASWEAYPGHEFIHTIGQLPCCATGGCWRSRSVPLGDGDEKDQPAYVCVDVVDHLPRCMDMITPEAVIERITRCMSNRSLDYLTLEQFQIAEPFLQSRIRRGSFSDLFASALSPPRTGALA